MTSSRTTSRFLLALALAASASTSGCATEADGDDDALVATSTTTSDLLVSNWAGDGNEGSAEESYRGAAIATLNGVTYAVRHGRCGAWSCWSDGEANELYWQKLTADGWTHGKRIPNQSANTRASLAAFNGSLYMVHSGSDNSTATWLSKFNPATETWSANYQLAFVSQGGPPALAAFNNKLYLIGASSASPYQMWYATMTTGETFSAPIAIANHYAASRTAAAVLNDKLYIAHRHGQTGEIVVGSTTNGATWTNPMYIYGGAGGAPIRGLEPALAVDGNDLHLVHVRPEGNNYVWWTYYNGCKWIETEVSLGTRTSTLAPTLAAHPSGLIMITTDNDDWNWVTESRYLKWTLYNRPFNPLPPTFPTCGVVIGSAAAST